MPKIIQIVNGRAGFKPRVPDSEIVVHSRGLHIEDEANRKETRKDIKDPEYCLLRKLFKEEGVGKQSVWKSAEKPNQMLFYWSIIRMPLHLHFFVGSLGQINLEGINRRRLTIKMADQMKREVWRKTLF